MHRVFLGAFAVLIAVLLLFNAASAAITVVLPAEAKLDNKGEVEFGQAAAGETFSVVIQKKSGEGFEWNSVVANMPNGWIAKYKVGDKTIVVEITVPANAAESVQVLNFTVSSPSPVAEETFKGIISVKKSLLTVTMNNLKQDAIVGKAVFYRFVASNDSIAEHTIAIESSLPDYWFQPLQLTLQPKQKQELTLSLTPQAYGLRNFSFFVKSRQNFFQKDFASELNIAPTIQGKFLASAYAFPFFTLSNFAYYVFNAIWFFPAQ